MPELPEVEVMARKLHGWVSGKRVTSVEALRNPGNRYDAGHAVGATCHGVFRRGKRLLFDLDCHDHACGAFYMVCHNAMSGYWDCEGDPWTFDYVEGARRPSDTDVRARISLNDGTVLRFHDARLFGSIRCPDTVGAREMLDGMGPEALLTERMLPDSPVFLSEDIPRIRDSKKPIKEVLLDQTRIAGVGNIYATEALWWARLHPTTPANRIPTDHLETLSDAIRCVLRAALDRSLDYRGLKAYRRGSCECGDVIKKIKVGGRSSYFCLSCQREEL